MGPMREDGELGGGLRWRLSGMFSGCQGCCLLMRRITIRELVVAGWASGGALLSRERRRHTASHDDRACSAHPVPVIASVSTATRFLEYH